MRAVRRLSPRTAVGRDGARGRAADASIALIFFYAPTDADQGFSQRIFYFHVPIALTSYACFGWGAWKALRVLWKRDERADLESYVAIHQGVIFGALTLAHRLDLGARVVGRLVVVEREPARALPRPLPLLLRVLHAALLGRAGPARANMCAVYALFGVVLIPVSFLAIRLSQQFIHPVVFNSHGPQMTGSQFFTFCVSLAAMLALFATLYQRRARGQAARRASARAAGAALT